MRAAAFESASDHAILDAHLRRPPPRPSAVSPAVPPELEAVILRALEKSPEARFQSAGDFREALQAVALAVPPPLSRKVAATVKASGTLPAAVQVGAQLGHYRLDGELGAGAMGTVFRGTDTRYERPVAIKVLSQDIAGVPKVLERLEREAVLQAKLSHPNIVAVHELVKDGGTSAIVMELVRGRTLEALLEAEAPLPPARAVAIACEILEALDLVHEHAIVHRDLKPGNVMLAAGARRETVKVADFGLALRPSEPRLSQIGSVMGTPLYMSPELCNGERDIDGRSDLYALGVMLFEMLTGRLPFGGETVPALMLAHTSAPPPPPSTLVAGIPPALDAAVVKAMAKRREDRFATASEMLDALEQAVGGVAGSRPSPAVGGVARPVASEPPMIGVRTTPPAAQGADAGKRRGVMVAALVVGGGGAVVVAAVVALGGGDKAATVGGGRADRSAEVGVVDPATARDVGLGGRTPQPVPLDAAASSSPRAAEAEAAGSDSCPAGMVRVPGGTFLMGSPKGVGDSDERPQRRVTPSPYCLDRTEVTVAAYEACGTCASAATTVKWPGLRGAERKAYDEAKVCNGNRADRQDHPANCITWTQADTYCRAVGKRLPTEAEWEFAARGTDGRLYPWGTTAPSARRLNACGSECRAFGKRLGFAWKVMYGEDDGHAATAPVGSYPDGASPFGVVDLAGNVWEWVADEYAPYPAGAVTDPRPATASGAAADKTYSLRGGGWSHDDPSHVRAAFRYGIAPSVRYFFSGFRCARGV